MNDLNKFIGLICYHEKTGGLMIIKKASINNDLLNFHCKVLVKDEKGEDYFADAIYNSEEVLISKTNYRELVLEYQLKKGTQLSLFS